MTPKELDALFEVEPIHTLGELMWHVCTEIIAWGIALTLIAGEIIGLIKIAGWLA